MPAATPACSYICEHLGGAAELPMVMVMVQGGEYSYPEGIL